MHVGEISPKKIPPAVYPFGPHQNPNVSCEFHTGYIRHIVEDCIVFKNRVHDLIDQNILSFTKEKPNVKANPWPNHGNQIMNAIIGKGSMKVVCLVEDVKTSWSSIFISMQKHGVLT